MRSALRRLTLPPALTLALREQTLGAVDRVIEAPGRDAKNGGGAAGARGSSVALGFPSMRLLAADPGFAL